MKLNGLRLDGKFSDSAEGTWAHAKNILLSRGYDEIENESGDSSFVSNITGTVIGRITTPADIILFVWANSKGYIKKITSTGTVTDLITGGSSYFNIDPATFPNIYIEGIYSFNASGQLIIAFTTGFHKPMLLNTSSSITISTSDDLKQLYLFPEFEHNNFSLTTDSATTTSSVISGGRLPSAAYFLSLTYELEPNVISNFGIISRPIFIMDDDTLTDYKQFKGNGSNIITNKALSINIANLDTDYNYFKIAVIKKTTESTDCFITKRIKINKINSTTNILITDLSDLILFPINEVVTSSPSFNTVKTIALVNKRARIGNLTKFTKLPINTIYDNLFTPKTIVLDHGIANPGKYDLCLTSVGGHYLSTGDIVTVSGFATSDYNGIFRVTKYDDLRFYYTVTTPVSEVNVPTEGVTCTTDVVSINWVSDKQASLYNTKNSYKDSVFIFNSKGFRSDETYALYLGLHLKTGGYYGIYHIPGRAEYGNEHSNVSIDGTNHKLYKTKSTATKQGDFYGKMGFWENENETYQNKYGTYLADNKVRHHRFPSAGQLNEWINGYMGSTTQPLDTFATGTPALYDEGNDTFNISLPVVTGTPDYGTYAEFDPDVHRMKYTATSKQLINFDFDYTVTHMHAYGSNPTFTMYVARKSGATVIDSHTFQGVWNSEDSIATLKNNTTFLLEAGEILEINMWITAGVDASRAVTVTKSNFSIYEGVAPANVLGLKISVNWQMISTLTSQLSDIIDGWEIFYAKRSLDNQLMLDQSIVFTEGTGYRFYGFDSMSNLLNIEPTHVKSEFNVGTSDYLSVGADTKEVFKYTPQAAEYSKVRKIKYLPAYNSATIPDNTGKENCYYFETEGGTFNQQLVNFINIKDNLYLDFSNQELVSTGLFKKMSDYSQSSFYGGDTYVGHNSVLKFESDVAKIWFFPVESILNSGLRYEGENLWEKCYPYTDILKVEDTTQTYIAAMKEAGIANMYFYNNDFHILNTLRQDNIDNDLTSIVNTFPNRIYSSMPQPLESTSVYWRKFKVLDYFDMENKKGAIYKMLGNEYVIYIQTEYSIFRGIVIDQLRTGDIDVALKSTEMFDRPLQELLDSEGRYIKPWNREGTILTPYGLVTVDMNRGSIYVISDKADEISKLGIEDWFRSTVKNVINLNSTNKESIGSGVILGYDDINSRLLVTVKNENIAVTSAIRSSTGGILVTVTTTSPHNIYTGGTIRMTGWNVSACNGVFIATKTGANTFTYTTTATATGAITGGTLKTIDNFTLSFHLEQMKWMCFHDYAPDKYISNSNGLYILNGTILRSMLTNNFGYYNDVYYPSSVDFIFNSNTGERFLLKNVKWGTNIESNGINYWDETISNLLVYSKNLCTNNVAISKRAYGYNGVSNALEESGNAIYQDGQWIYDDIKDYLITPNSVFLDANYNLITTALNLLKNYFEVSKFITKFIIVRMSFTNTSANKKLRISNISIDAKKVL